MKLIKILALATAMATMATAQNTGANNQKKGATPTPSPTPTPAGLAKSGGKPTAGTKTPVTAGQPVVTKSGSTATVKEVSPQKPAPTSSPKPTVKSGSLPEKTKTGQTTSTGTIKASPLVTKPVVTNTKPVVKTNSAAVQAKPPAKSVKATPKTGTSAVTKSGPPAAPAKVTAPKVKETGPPATAEKPKPGRALGARGRRDPFISPIRTSESITPTPSCTSGKRCLAIPELVLQGTVKDLTGKMLAVVVNSSHHTYFLRENDQVFNGSVEKITSDSIIFREFVKDPLGRESAHEVVKKLVPTS